MARDILEYFPPTLTPRPQQVQALHYVQEVLAKGYRDVALGSPTGIGKSLIASTISSWAKDNLTVEPKNQPGAHILVQQKVLQDQIEKELDRLGGKEKAALIKASIEYPCAHFKRCSVGLIDRRCPCVNLGSCTYRLAKARFLTATVAVTNYSYFFTERAHVGQLESRQVLICDEAHNLTRTLARLADVVVAEDKLSHYAPGIPAAELYRITTLNDFTAWLEDDYQPEVQAQAELLQALSDDDTQMKEAYEVAQHLLKVEGFLARVKASPRGWVFWPEESRDRKLTLTARPLDTSPYFEEFIGRHIPVRVYLSAFLGAKSIFCSELGLDPKRVAWLQQASPFAVKNRPIHLLGVGSMSRQNQEATLPAMLRMVLRIVQAHPDTRGIIHTNSYRLADEVAPALVHAKAGARVIYPKTAEAREGALLKHAALPGGILISPSVGEGFDFRGDLARWQIIVKAPFLSLGDKHTVTKMEQNGAWYQAETIKHFLQICGRIVRSEDDVGQTFVLDSDIARVLHETRDILPKWFRAALFTAEGEPFFVE